MRDEGYLIVHCPEWWVDEVLPRREPKYKVHYEQLRAALSFVDPRAYRGMAREPLAEYPPPAHEDFYCKRGFDMSEKRARIRLRDLLDARESPDEPDDGLLSTLDRAAEVFSLLDEPARRELVHVSRSVLGQTSLTLGYDIGWWSGAFYSIVWDTFVLPTWHPPDPVDNAEVAEHARSLNANVLFDTVGDALRFRDWYVTKWWAETGEFWPVRIESVPMPNGRGNEKR